MDTALSGRVALVTGAGSGLGEATARALGEAGCMVACLDLREAAAARVAREIGAERATAIACDVSDAAQVARAVEAAAERFGGLDILVNSAAIDHTYSVEELSVEQWDQVLAVNLRGPFLLSKAAFPLMRARRGGHIVNVASTAALRAWGGASPYHASKWGLLGFGRGLGVEGRPHNIRVTTLIPGGMRTHFFDRFVEQGIPMPDPDKLQDPANVAEAILFALRAPAGSVVQELMVTPLNETSWP
jgi:NAD(P)-dependent dehydrogenase (short-subunit alcohol dehydrogenase family)